MVSLSLFLFLCGLSYLAPFQRFTRGGNVVELLQAWDLYLNVYNDGLASLKSVTNISCVHIQLFTSFVFSIQVKMMHLQHASPKLMQLHDLALAIPGILIYFIQQQSQKTNNITNRNIRERKGGGEDPLLCTGVDCHSIQTATV